MKKIAYVLPALFAAAVPFLASAHEHDTFTIKGVTYNFVVGSLNEPLVVDDKTGLDLTVTKGGGVMTMSSDGDMDGPAVAAVPVTGLENTLKVEMVAGGQKKSFELSPQWGKAGAYQTTFYATVATTFSYHLTGTIEKNPIDLVFTCVPEGAPKAADDHAALKLSDSVTRTMHGGAFGCARAKENLGFPESSASLNSLKGGGGTWGVGLGIIGALLGGFALARKRL